MIARTSFAVSTEESRPILNGVLWQLADGQMRMVATNGHRLAKLAVPAEAGEAPHADLIVPPKALAQVQRLFDEGTRSRWRGARTTWGSGRMGPGSSRA
jgi:DNA polymerase III subunit beta